MQKGNIPSLKESDVFISYGRAQSKYFASKLNKILINNGFEVWFDQNDIPLAVDFQTQIDEGILKTHNFIFIISPHSIQSSYCLKEINLAIKYNKRIIPILHIEPDSEEIWNKMHPTVSKLNWLYFRELRDDSKPLNEWKQIDNFKKASQSLVELLHSNYEYINKHTLFLIKAVEWERNHRKHELLLKGKDLLKAEKWVKYKFKDEQAPVIPTLLHYEYISESKEVENNNQTDIFISYNKNDIEFVKKLNFFLLSNGFTNWIEILDFLPGTDYKETRYLAIEKASCFIFILSKKSIKSDKSLKELEYALNLNKLIIPIQIENLENNALPEEIQKIYRLNFNKTDTDLELEKSKLINVLENDYNEIKLQKEILVKALNWERNDKEIKYLLRGFDLEQAHKWLEESFIRKEYEPTQLQVEFIKKSSTVRETVFISYARNPSKEFATVLYDRLKEQNYDVWFDQKNIPLAVDFQDQIDIGIKKSDNFIFIISPKSIQSQYCEKEINLAVKYNKRIIPVLHVEPTENWEDMPEIISKINWVYAREKQDDFEKAFQGINEVIKKHTKFVKKHTQLLIKSLKWKQNEKNEKYLLHGAERITAENWLYNEYVEDQGMPQPSIFHCEYIISSRIEAFQGQSDVFFSYAEDDVEIKEKIYNNLLRKGISAVDNSKIKIEGEYIKAIHEAIEKADNFIFLVSSKSIKTAYCLEELSHALIFDKRIILLSTELINKENLFEELQDKHMLKFHDDTDEVFAQEINKLIQIINTDNEYLYQHKVLFNKALLWKKQKSNPCMLLTGFELENALSWFEIAKNKKKHTPVPLHNQYINQSKENQHNYDPEIYIGYHISDNDFAQKLNLELQTSAKYTWFDHQYISDKKIYNTAIERAIENSDNILFVLSKNTANNLQINKEIEYAKKLNKRIFYIDIDQNTKNNDKFLSSNDTFIDFSNYIENFHQPFSELIRELDYNKKDVKEHTRWLLKANSWKKRNKTKDLLLRGEELKAAKLWYLKVKKENSKLKPLPIQSELISESLKLLKSEERKTKQLQQLKKIAVIIVIVLFISSTIFAYIATKQKHISRKLLENTEVDRLILTANEILEKDPTSALQLTLNAYKINNNNKALKKIYHIYQKNHFYNIINKQNKLYSNISLSPNQKLIAAVDADRVDIFTLKGKLINTIWGHYGIIYSVEFSPDNKKIITASEDQTAILWDLNGNKLVTLAGHHNSVNQASFSPDGKKIITVSEDSTAILWNTNGDKIKTFIGHNGTINRGIFTPNGKKVLTASSDSTIKLWSLDGSNLKTFKGHENSVWSLDINAKGDKILSSGADKKLIVWDINGAILSKKTSSDYIFDAVFSKLGDMIIQVGLDQSIKILDLKGNLLSKLQGHNGLISNIEISSDNKYILSCSKDQTIRLWNINDYQKLYFDENQSLISVVSFLNKDKDIIFNKNNKLFIKNLSGETKQIFKGHENNILSLSVSYNTDRLLTTSYGNEAILWNKKGDIIKILKDHEDMIWASDFSPDGKQFLTASDDGLLLIYNNNGELINKIFKEDFYYYDAKFSSDGKYIITANLDNRATLMTDKGKIVRMFIGHEGAVLNVDFSPDGNKLLTASEDKTIRLWDLYGNQLQVFKGHTDMITDIDFSPDGNYIVSSSIDNTVRLWTLDGYCINVYKTGQDLISDVDFSSDGNYIITSGAIGIIRVFKTKENWQTFLASYDIQDLSPLQKLQYKIIKFDDVISFTTINDLKSAFKYYNKETINEQSNNKKVDLQQKKIKILERMIELFPDNTEFKTKMAANLSELSNYYIKSKNFKKAMKSAEKALEYDAREKSIYSNLALAYLLNNNYKKAEIIYTEFKDKPYNDMISFKDLFIGDIIALEAENIKHKDFDKIINLLGAYTEN